MIGEDEWNVDAAVQFIIDNNSRNVALQFPHDLIASAHAILRSIKDRLSERNSSAAVRPRPERLRSVLQLLR